MKNQKEMKKTNEENHIPFVLTVQGDTDSHLLRLTVGVFRAAIMEQQKAYPEFEDQIIALVPIVSDQNADLKGLNGTPIWLEEWLRSGASQLFTHPFDQIVYATEIKRSFRENWNKDSFLFRQVSELDLFVDRTEENSQKSVNLFGDPKSANFVFERGSILEKFSMFERLITQARSLARKIRTGYFRTEKDSLEEATKSTEKSEDSDNHNPNPNEPKTETMDALLRSLDLSYSQDVSVFEQAMKAALFDLFSGKPSDDWHEWLLGCFVTGMQARLPEVALIWEQSGRYQTQSGTHLTQIDLKQFKIRND